jgi:hypothetical protein
MSGGRVVTVDVAASVVSAVPLDIADDGLEASDITIRVMNTDGNPMVGLDASEIVVSATGTGNTVTQPTGVVDSQGYIYGAKLVSTGIATKTISVAVCGATLTDAPQVVVGAFDGVTLTGTGFGTKSTVAPLYFNTFDGFADGDPVEDTGLAILNQTQSPATVTNDRAHSGTLSLMQVYPENDGELFPGIGKSGVTGSPLDIYVGHWVYWERTIGDGSGLTPVFKWARGGGGAIYSGTPKFLSTIRPALDGTFGNPNGDTGYNDGDGTYVADNTMAEGPTRDAWHFVEYKYRMSNPAGTANGKYQWLCNGTLNANLTSAVTRATGVTAAVDWVMTAIDGMDNYGLTNEYRQYIDEVLLDTTFARVIATDNATYASSTKFAPQRPTAWSDTEITISTPNWSDLTSASTAYFHIWDADDTYIGSVTQVVP